MHGQRTPSPPSSRHQRPSAPTAPYAYTHDLPPSPVTPSNRHLAPAPGSRAPYMGTVDLPLSRASYGLMTPPSSPDKFGGHGQVLHIIPCLMPEHVHTMAPFLLFNPPPCNPQLAQQPATSPPMSVVYIHIGARTFTIMSRSSSVCLTVADVLQQLHKEWTRFRGQDDGTIITSYTKEHNAVGDLFADRGHFFAGLTPSRRGPDHLDLHIKF